jgi:hypothetical protein
MAALTPYLIVGWLGVAWLLFRRLPAHVAVLIVVVAGVLFLPELHATGRTADTPSALPLPVVKFSKSNTIGYALLLGSLVFDRRRWATVYPRWFDVPMALWCAAPLLATIVNGLGPYGGLYESATVTLNQLLVWGVPYWFGRLYFGSRDGLQALAAAVMLGGLAYVPLCLFEQNFGPELHRWLYGYYQHDVKQAIRGSGFRPMVFMEHGLAVAFWMMTASLTAFWLWHEGTYRAFSYHPRRRAVTMGLVVLVLVVTTVLCRSAGAIVLGVVGGTALVIARRFRVVLPLVVLIAVPPLYLAARATDTWTGHEPAAVWAEYFGAERAESLDFRLKQEAQLLDRAREKAIFGWGLSGKWRIEGRRGEDVTVSDSLWIITFATTGAFGLVTLVTAVLLPAGRYLWYNPPRRWQGSVDAPAVVLATVLILYMLDHLVNAMLNPVFMLAAGGLAGAAAHFGVFSDASDQGY